MQSSERIGRLKKNAQTEAKLGLDVRREVGERYLSEVEGQGSPSFFSLHRLELLNLGFKPLTTLV